jgi:type IV pilus assembly protein PilV
MKNARGFTMVEVLVSIVIVAIGLLGMAGLTAASLKSNNTSYYRSQATVLANDILDRMRANVVQARGQQYDIAAGPAYTAAAGTLQRFDCEEWFAAVQAALPGGTGTVDVNAGTATIVITWDGGESSFTTISRL